MHFYTTDSLENIYSNSIYKKLSRFSIIPLDVKERSLMDIML